MSSRRRPSAPSGSVREVLLLIGVTAAYILGWAQVTIWWPDWSGLYFPVTGLLSVPVILIWVTVSNERLRDRLMREEFRESPPDRDRASGS